MKAGDYQVGLMGVRDDADGRAGTLIRYGKRSIRLPAPFIGVMVAGGWLFVSTAVGWQHYRRRRAA